MISSTLWGIRTSSTSSNDQVRHLLRVAARAEQQEIMRVVVEGGAANSDRPGVRDDDIPTATLLPQPPPRRQAPGLPSPFSHRKDDAESALKKVSREDDASLPGKNGRHNDGSESKRSGIRKSPFNSAAGGNTASVSGTRNGTNARRHNNVAREKCAHVPKYGPQQRAISTANGRQWTIRTVTKRSDGKCQRPTRFAGGSGAPGGLGHEGNFSASVGEPGGRWHEAAVADRPRGKHAALNNNNIYRSRRSKAPCDFPVPWGISVRLRVCVPAVHGTRV